LLAFPRLLVAGIHDLLQKNLGCRNFCRIAVLALDYAKQTPSLQPGTVTADGVLLANRRFRCAVSTLVALLHGSTVLA
jgi:hypothetical protein